MHPRILIKSAGRTASHLMLGLLEQQGYRLHWTEQHSTDSAREPILADPEPQAWYDHQQGWPNPEVAWHCVLISRRDRHRQIMSKILSQHTQEFVFFTERDIEPIRVTRREWDWTARFVADCEHRWLHTAPAPMIRVYTEDLIHQPHSTVRRISPGLPDSARSRFPVNPRPLESLCVNWAETQNWPVPDSLL
jgi:hypothetical protein